MVFPRQGEQYHSQKLVYYISDEAGYWQTTIAIWNLRVLLFYTNHANFNITFKRYGRNILPNWSVVLFLQYKLGLGIWYDWDFFLKIIEIISELYFLNNLMQRPISKPKSQNSFQLNYTYKIDVNISSNYINYNRSVGLSSILIYDTMCCSEDVWWIQYGATAQHIFARCLYLESNKPW